MKESKKELRVDSADKGANKVSKLADLDIAKDAAKEESTNVADVDTVDSTASVDPQPHREQPDESRGKGEHLDAATDNEEVDTEVSEMKEAHRVGGDPKRAPETEDNSSEAVQESPIGPTSAPSPEKDVADVEGTEDRRADHDGSQPRVQAETPSVKELCDQVSFCKMPAERASSLCIWSERTVLGQHVSEMPATCVAQGTRALILILPHTKRSL